MSTRSLNQKTLDRYTLYIEDIHTRIRKGQKIVPSVIRTQHKVGAIAFTLLRKMGLVQETQEKYIFRFTENRSFDDNFFFARLAKRLLREVNTYQNKSKAKLEKKKERFMKKLAPTTVSSLNEKVEETREVLQDLLKEEVKEAKSTSHIQTGSLLIPTKPSTKSSDEDVVLKMSKTKARALLVILGEVKNPHSQSLLSELSSDLFEQAFY